MSRNLMISDTDFVQNGTLSAGPGSPGAPLANRKDLRPQVVAEATSTSVADSTFDVDFGATKTVSLFYFAWLFADAAAATVRVRAGTDATFAATNYDSTAVLVQPAAYSNEEFAAIGRSRVFIPNADISARYVQVNIDNSAGSLAPQVGCFIAASSYLPGVNIKPNPEITPLDESDIARVPGGSTYRSLRQIRHRLTIEFNPVFKSAGFGDMLRLARIKARRTPLVVSLFPDDDDAIGRERATFYGTIAADSILKGADPRRYGTTWQLETLI